MKLFKTRTYEIQSPKIPAGSSACFALLADLHGLVFGRDNELLIKAVCDSSPDAVLVAGDMIVREEPGTMESAKRLLLALAEHYPVYYALGNHEYKLVGHETRGGLYQDYEDALAGAGVIFLHNDRAVLEKAGMRFTFHGLELPIEYYHKPNSPRLSLAAMESLLGTAGQEGLQVLLAHNPKYGKTYFSWGADLIVSGHYHGGVLRLSEHCGLTSPQFLLFPPFCCGEFVQGQQHMLVSAGLGEHTIPVRIHNPRELLIIRMKPLEKETEIR